MNDKINGIGIFLIIIGIIFAIENYYNFYILYKLWPLFITFLGAGFLGIFTKRGRREAVFLGIGLYLILFSIFSLYLNFASWATLTFLWPVFIGLFGVTFLSIYFFHLKNKIYLFIALIMISITIVFFVVFTLSGDFWWLTFILIGLSIIIAGRLQNAKS